MPNESKWQKTICSFEQRGTQNLFKIDICMLRYIYIVTAKRELEIVMIFQAMHVLRHWRKNAWQTVSGSNLTFYGVSSKLGIACNNNITKEIFCVKKLCHLEKIVFLTKGFFLLLFLRKIFVMQRLFWTEGAESAAWDIINNAICSSFYIQYDLLLPALYFFLSIRLNDWNWNYTNFLTCSWLAGAYATKWMVCTGPLMPDCSTDPDSSNQYICELVTRKLEIMLVLLRDERSRWMRYSSEGKA
jgi:hypothetical protein